MAEASVHLDQMLFLSDQSRVLGQLLRQDLQEQTLIQLPTSFFFPPFLFQASLSLILHKGKYSLLLVGIHSYFHNLVHVLEQLLLKVSSLVLCPLAKELIRVSPKKLKVNRLEFLWSPWVQVTLSSYPS